MLGNFAHAGGTAKREDVNQLKWVHTFGEWQKVEVKENSGMNGVIMHSSTADTQADIPPPKRQRILEPQKSCSSTVRNGRGMALKCRESFVPAVLSPEGFQRLFKGITGMDFFPCWKPTKKTTRFIFRKATDDLDESYVFNGERLDVAALTEKLMAEHAKISREPVTVEVRSRKVLNDLYLADLPQKYDRKGIEGTILDETCTSPKPQRCLFVPEKIDDAWIMHALYTFVDAEQQRLFAVQVPQWTKQKMKRLEMIRNEIRRLESVDRAPSSVTVLAKQVGISLVLGVKVLLNGCVRRNYPQSMGRTFASELLTFAQALGNGPDSSLNFGLPDKRFQSWPSYAAYFENDKDLVNKMHSKEPLHGGSSYARLAKECEISVRFARPELPDTREALYEHLRVRLLQGGGVSRPSWRSLVDKILCEASQNVLQETIRYCSCRNQWFLMEHKTQVVAWLCTLSGSADEFNYPAVFIKHAQVFHERMDILEAIYDAYDHSITKLAATFERSFLDVLTAIFDDLPGFFTRLKKKWEVEAPQKALTDGGNTDAVPTKTAKTSDAPSTQVLILKSIDGSKDKTITCDPRKVDDQGYCMTFGRNESNFFVEADPRVSGNHFAIKLSDSNWILIDRSTNGTWVNGEKVGKNREVIIQTGNSVSIINPNAQPQANMTFTVQFKLLQEGVLPRKSRATAAARVLREMKKDKSASVLEGVIFDPMTVEENLPKIANLILRGFDLLRSWVADQVPLFIEAFFKQPLESRLMDAMSEIQIDMCSQLPEIDAKLSRLQGEEAEVCQLIKDLQDRRHDTLGSLLKANQ
eukprot:GEMP01010778.1.p1 GENE.GEMP01010778.1~~GEMP01010778.1.p1  ORF type:complete len:810 (+),score=172.99 GEMP01010778.1:49-2478(+)